VLHQSFPDLAYNCSFPKDDLALLYCNSSAPAFVPRQYSIPYDPALLYQASCCWRRFNDSFVSFKMTRDISDYKDLTLLETATGARHIGATELFEYCLDCLLQKTTLLHERSLKWRDKNHILVYNEIKSDLYRCAKVPRVELRAEL
jgi:hypothetical protein